MRLYRYSANIMTLVVYSNQALDDTEALVRAKFSEVVNKDVTLPKFDDPPAFTPDHL